MAWSYSGETGLKVFTYLVYLSVVTVAIPYFFSACAQLTYLVSRRRPVHGWALARDLAVAVVGAAFSLWVTFASGYQSVYQAMLLLLLGIPLYAFLKARRERLGQVEEPIDVPASSWTSAEPTKRTSCARRRRVAPLGHPAVARPGCALRPRSTGPWSLVARVREAHREGEGG